MTDKKQLDYSYDYLADALFIYVVGSSDYEEAIEINNNTYLSLDEDSYPVALEILDASKVLHVKKFNLKNIKSINLKTCINNKEIIVDCVLEVPIHNKNQIKSTNSVIVNDMNLPNITAELATA
ncbi:DUF2283 domain-containing protein [Methanobrevibacter sp.]|uniref:DUF2283 domain-containing protein n=1 Tax=Methanobrevibacter sp. TaxID=66852 RepID=UPI00263333BC|nr:DUF2283 domain-containing protein [uncultured Methanobrevibacter sp.]